MERIDFTFSICNVDLEGDQYSFFSELICVCRLLNGRLRVLRAYKPEFGTMEDADVAKRIIDSLNKSVDGDEGEGIVDTILKNFIAKAETTRPNFVLLRGIFKNGEPINVAASDGLSTSIPERLEQFKHVSDMSRKDVIAAVSSITGKSYAGKEEFIANGFTLAICNVSLKDDDYRFFSEMVFNFDKVGEDNVMTSAYVPEVDKLVDTKIASKLLEDLNSKIKDNNGIGVVDDMFSKVVDDTNLILFMPVFKDGSTLCTPIMYGNTDNVLDNVKYFRGVAELARKEAKEQVINMLELPKILN